MVWKIMFWGYWDISSLIKRIRGHREDIDIIKSFYFIFNYIFFLELIYYKLLSTHIHFLNFIIPLLTLNYLYHHIKSSVYIISEKVYHPYPTHDEKQKYIYIITKSGKKLSLRLVVFVILQFIKMKQEKKKYKGIIMKIGRNLELIQKAFGPADYYGINQQ
jgi:hypothetical protein